MPASYPTTTFAPATRTASTTIGSAHINDLQAEVTAIEAALRTSLAHDLLFVDALYDIGKSGVTRPRDGFFSRNVTVGGVLTVSGFGTHLFSAGGTGGNNFAVENTTAGTGNYSSIRAGNDISQLAFAIYMHSSTYTTAGTAIAAGAKLEVTGAGGLGFNTTHPSGLLYFYTQNVERLRISAVGNVKIAGTAARATTEGTNHLDIFDGTAPVGTLANGVSLYSTAGELLVMDAAGNATPLSPHDHTPNWVFQSHNATTKKYVRIEMELLMKRLNRLFGEPQWVREEVA